MEVMESLAEKLPLPSGSPQTFCGLFQGVSGASGRLF
jgi:hypothetical protein